MTSVVKARDRGDRRQGRHTAAASRARTITRTTTRTITRTTTRTHHAHDHAHDHAHGAHVHHARTTRSRAARTRITTTRTSAARIEGAELTEGTKRRALDIFDRIARAEAKLHGTTVDDVAFHEVGAIDSVVDVVGTAAALDWLSPATRDVRERRDGARHDHVRARRAAGAGTRRARGAARGAAA